MVVIAYLAPVVERRRLHPLSFCEFIGWRYGAIPQIGVCVCVFLVHFSFLFSPFLPPSFLTQMRANLVSIEEMQSFFCRISFLCTPNGNFYFLQGETSLGRLLKYFLCFRSNHVACNSEHDGVHAGGVDDHGKFVPTSIPPGGVPWGHP